MKIPVGTREEEREVHHYVERYKVTEPVYTEVPFPLIALLIAFVLALLWGIYEPRQDRQQPTINIHIENNNNAQE